MNYAGFWIRAGAALLDGLIMLVPNLILTVAIYQLVGEPLPYGPGPHMATAASHLTNLLGTALWIGYYIYFNGGHWQATPGKRICGIYVCRPDGAPITYARALGRICAEIVSYFTLGIGFIMVAFTREKTALHDLIADTRVIYGKR